MEEEEEEAETAAVMAGESIGEKRRNRMRPTTIEFVSDKPTESSGRLLPVVLKPTEPGKCGRQLHRAMHGRSARVRW